MTGRLTLQEQIGAVDNSGEPTPPWNRPAVIVSLTLVFGVFTTMAMVSRLYTRIKILKAPGWDDLFIGLILLMGSVGTVSVCLGPFLGGAGQHIVDLSDEQRQMYFKLFYIGDGSFVTSVGLIKLSLLLQYLRIFTEGPHRYVCLASLTIVAAWTIVTAFMAWFPCFPVAGFWDWEIEGRKCYAYGSPFVNEHYAMFLSHSIVNMSLDVLILAIPMPLLFRKSTVKRTKLGLSGLLVIGVIAIVFAALRLSETVKHRAMSHPTFDHPWYSPTLCILGMLEVDLTCIGASVPVFWPIVRDRFGAIFVTREIKISVAERNIDELNLQRSESLYSHDGSEGRRLWEEGSAGASRHGKGAADGHYKDTYVMDHVDPLRKKGVEAIVTARNTSQTRLTPGSKDS